MEALMQDIRLAFRALRKTPLFTLTAVLVLTLGIGASIAIFSVVNAVILKPVPFPEADRLVQIVHTDPDGVPANSSGSPVTYMLWRELTDVIEDVAAYRSISFNYTGADVPEPVAASRVTEPYFRTFRVPLALGRPFSVDEDSPGAPLTTVVSHDFWMRRLGGNPDVIGSTLSLSGDAYTIIGVTALEFDARELGDIDVWVPYQLDPNTFDDGRFLKVAARLKPGVALEQAQARLAGSIAVYWERFPNSALNKNIVFGAVLFQDAVIGTGSSTLFRNSPRRMLWLLFGSVAIVLLIACANVASLMLMRARGRDREIAIRSALGAGRWRIARQFLTESVILSAAGGALGLVLGYVGIRALLAINTGGLPRLGEAGSSMSMDWRVIGFAILVSVATPVLFGLLPALVASRSDLNSVIKYSSNRSSAGFRESRSRSVLVVAEVGLAVLLLVGAALLIRTTLALNRVDPGFNIDDVVVMRTSLSDARFHTPTAMQALSTSTVERIRAIPGVRAASASCCVPLQRSWGTLFKVIGRDDGGRAFTSGADVTITMGDYFEVFDVPVIRGRIFDGRDDSSSAPVVVVNRAFAERYWPDGQDPLADRMSVIGAGSPAVEDGREVIGIVENVRKTRLDELRPTMYLPLAQIPDTWLETMLKDEALAWLVRTNIDPMQLAAPIRDIVTQTTDVPVTDVQPMKEVVSESISRQRANMLLMTVFGGTALLLAAIGLYGLVAFSVQQRTHEIGIRMALGAQRDRIVSMVIRQGMFLVGAGTVIGLTAAFVLADLLASVLFGVEARDTAVFAGVPAILVLVGFAAVSVPALRASLVSPLSALRYE